MSEQPVVAGITPATITMPVLSIETLEVWLDIPADPMAGSTVELSLVPGTFSYVLESSVVVPADNLSETFYVYSDVLIGTDELTASLGGGIATATINVGPPEHLVINEVDYDQPNFDLLEFVEIYNGTASTVDLTNLSLVLMNGSDNTEYDRIPLAPASTLASGEYLVIGSSDVLATVPASAKTIDFGSPANNIQNGDPDGIAILDEAASTIEDALSYEGEITAGLIAGVGPVNFVEGTATTVVDSNSETGSLVRYPNGYDSGSAADDWWFSTSVTPGEANLHTP
jgi:hypothetical protein